MNHITSLFKPEENNQTLDKVSKAKQVIWHPSGYSNCHEIDYISSKIDQLFDNNDSLIVLRNDPLLNTVIENEFKGFRPSKAFIVERYLEKGFQLVNENSLSYKNNQFIRLNTDNYSEEVSISDSIYNEFANAYLLEFKYTKTSEPDFQNEKHKKVFAEAGSQLDLDLKKTKDLNLYVFCLGIGNLSLLDTLLSEKIQINHLFLYQLEPSYISAISTLISYYSHMLKIEKIIVEDNYKEDIKNNFRLIDSLGFSDYFRNQYGEMILPEIRLNNTNELNNQRPYDNDILNIFQVRI